MTNLALVYDGSIRDNGTPFYYRVALTRLFPDLPWYTEANKIPEGHDFYIHIDDGRDDLHRVPPEPWGYYAIDTHLGFDIRLHKAKQADVVWCAQRSGVQAFREHGIEAKWLPLACDPMAHPTAAEMGAISNRKPFDIGFVGHLQDPDESDRIPLLDVLIKEFPLSIVSVGLFHREMAAVYHNCRIAVNHSVRGDLNMRFFEIASLGVPQLAPNMEGLEDLGFLPWEHYIPYSSPSGAVGNLNWALTGGGDAQEDSVDLNAMAHRAYMKVRAKHTYDHRVQTMLESI